MSGARLSVASRAAQTGRAAIHRGDRQGGAASAAAGPAAHEQTRANDAAVSVSTCNKKAFDGSISPQTARKHADHLKCLEDDWHPFLCV